MTEQDPLRGHFDAFRAQTVGSALPPPVEEFPRRLRVRRRRRIAAVAFAVVALLALVTLPSWGQDTTPPPPPATSPTPAPSPTGSSAVAAAPPPPSGAAPSGTSAAGSHAPTSAGTCGTSPRGLPLLPNGREALLSYNDDQTRLVPSPANLFDLCPAARVPLVHVSFGWDVGAQQYVRVYLASYVLTKAQPSLPRPGRHTLEDNGCGEIDTLLATSRAVPTTIPRSVPDSADPTNAAMDYLQKSALALPYGFSVYSTAKLKSLSYCQPKSPTPSPQA